MKILPKVKSEQILEIIRSSPMGHVENYLTYSVNKITTQFYQIDIVRHHSSYNPYNREYTYQIEVWKAGDIKNEENMFLKFNITGK